MNCLISGLLLDPATIHASLASILDRPLTPNRDSISVLTTLDRNTWADVREQIERNETNRSNLNRIDGALFALCLDDTNTTDPQRLTKSLLCGDDGSNR
jgi:hypothetical protein